MVVEEQIFASRLFWVNQLNEPKKRILKLPLASPRDSKTTLSNMKIQENASLVVYLELEEGVKWWALDMYQYRDIERRRR